MDENHMSRRAVAGFVTLAPLLASRPANADEQTNIAFVTKFCDDWESKDVEKLIPYLAPEIEYHVFEGGPIIKGIDQFRAQGRVHERDAGDQLGD